MALARESGRYIAVPRSALIDASLTRQNNLDQAVSCVYQNQYILMAGDRIYVLHGDKIYVPKGAVRSRLWYEAVILQGPIMSCLAVGPQGLSFGTAQGKLYAFYREEGQDVYLDDGQPISAYWTTPQMGGQSFDTYGELTHFYLEVGEEGANLRLTAYSGGVGRVLAHKVFSSCGVLHMKLRAGRHRRLSVRIEDVGTAAPFTLQKWLGLLEESAVK